MKNVQKRMSSWIQSIQLIIPCFVVGMVLSTTVYSQETDNAVKLQRAQQMEDANEWERALSIYQDLYRSALNNTAVYDGLQRSYARLKQYDSAIVIVQRWLQQEPSNIQAMGTLAGLYYDSGQEQRADSVWHLIILIDKHNIGLYRYVASEMTERRLFDRAIDIYRQGREESKNETTFALEVAQLFAALQKYSEATQEYLRLIKDSSVQLMQVQSGINQMLSTASSYSPILSTIKTAITNEPENLSLRKLYAWLLIEKKNFTEALEQYRVIDRRSHAEGNELYNFAQQLLQVHADSVASEAFGEILNDYPQKPFVLPALYGYARAKEELLPRSQDGSSRIDDTTQSIADVLNRYQDIVVKYPHTEIAAQALFRIGTIRFVRLSDFNGARDALMNIPQITASDIVYDAILLIGDIQVVRNDLDAAAKEYSRLLSVPVYHDRALYRLAELNFFEAKFDSALAQLRWFESNLKNDITNSALSLEYFIQENISAPDILSEYSLAALNARQLKYSEALLRFDNIINAHPHAFLVDYALIQKADMQVKLNKIDDALKTLRYLADTVKMTICNDEAQFKIADIYQNIVHREKDALAAYEELLQRYPNSLYVEETRKRIRFLRGN